MPTGVSEEYVSSLKASLDKLPEPPGYKELVERLKGNRPGRRKTQAPTATKEPVDDSLKGFAACELTELDSKAALAALEKLTSLQSTAKGKPFIKSAVRLAKRLEQLSHLVEAKQALKLALLAANSVAGDASEETVKLRTNIIKALGALKAGSNWDVIDIVAADEASPAPSSDPTDEDDQAEPHAGDEHNSGIGWRGRSCWNHDWDRHQYWGLPWYWLAPGGFIWGSQTTVIVWRGRDEGYVDMPAYYDGPSDTYYWLDASRVHQPLR